MEFYEMSDKALRANCSGARCSVRLSVTYFITIIVTLDAVPLSCATTEIAQRMKNKHRSCNLTHIPHFST